MVIIIIYSAALTNRASFGTLLDAARFRVLVLKLIIKRRTENTDVLLSKARTGS